MPRMKLFVALALRCPICGYSTRYDGKHPTTECPVCKKKEEELGAIDGIGESLARKGQR